MSSGLSKSGAGGSWVLEALPPLLSLVKTKLFFMFSSFFLVILLADCCAF